jgi:hypothetical protein
MDVYEMTQEQFVAALAERTTAQYIFENADKIYQTMTGVMGQDCSDSVLREWAFEWASTELGCDYDDIYNRWLYTD